MLLYEQLNIIQEQLNRDNANEFVETLIMQYANSVENISELLSFIPKIADKQLKIKHQHIHDYAWAYQLMLGERCIYPIAQRKSRSRKKYNPDFPTLLYGCKVHFPDGNCNGRSQAEKEFFTEFIQMVKNKIGFDYENKDDWNWICNIANCREWMLKVIKQNVDDEFIEPEIKLNKVFR